MGKSFVALIKSTNLQVECVNKGRPDSVSFKYNKDSNSRYDTIDVASLWINSQINYM